jgi:hypothetical protein
MEANKMDYGMIGKIEKAKRYAQEPERVTFVSFTVEIRGDNNAYVVTLAPDGWDCSCSGFRAHGICPHVMAMERLLKPMLKREPLPYATGQNIVSDIEKAKRYAEETDRIHFSALEVNFRGDNSDHHTSLHDDAWSCNCDFFGSRGVCCHSMAMERLLKGMVPVSNLLVT